MIRHTSLTAIRHVLLSPNNAEYTYFTSQTTANGIQMNPFDFPIEIEVLVVIEETTNSLLWTFRTNTRLLVNTISFIVFAQ